MIIDHRTYNVIPGKINDFLSIYQNQGWPLQQKYLGDCSGWYVSMDIGDCLLYTSPSPRDLSTSRMPSSA